MDSISTGTLLIVLVILILLSAFSSSETGLMSLSRYKLRHLAQIVTRLPAGSKLLARRTACLDLILIGNNLVKHPWPPPSRPSSASRLFGDLGVAIATFGLTLVVLVFGEVTPKTLAAMFPERIAYPAILDPQGLMVPFALVCHQRITNLLLKYLRRARRMTPRSEEAHAPSSTGGRLSFKHHQEMLVSILDLDKMTVENIMVPRSGSPPSTSMTTGRSYCASWPTAPTQDPAIIATASNGVVGFLHSRDALRLVARDQFKVSLLRGSRPHPSSPRGPLNVQLAKFQHNKGELALSSTDMAIFRG